MQDRTAAGTDPNLVVVGQAPSRSFEGSPAFPPGSRSRARLDGLLGPLAASSRFVNLLDRFPGKQGKGDAFPAAEAREAASRFRSGDAGLLLLAGKRVAAAFGLRGTGYFEPAAVGRTAAFVVPHPSGVNRWWNDPANRAAAAEFFDALRHRAPPA